MQLSEYIPFRVAAYLKDVLACITRPVVVTVGELGPSLYYAVSQRGGAVAKLYIACVAIKQNAGDGLTCRRESFCA